ncbi:MAG: hypothetical protein CFE23_09615 [Flavobacterium sp. BFFFF1]|uniref:hypothetical protein n=1 Tax=Flavobacterium sp. BFFFF1 TaxID=2015557 RepID=UPI000BC6B506|nr:hypothetical protein [Flavobacterium sp. BFFFF1]OYU80315.1 MAG: hypothetical protein CFE23_09615 [Flavobacterium sp. BFFFF1]
MKKKKLYLIGQVPSFIDAFCEAKFRKTQKQLTKSGFIICNPILRLTNDSLERDEAVKLNLQDLMFSDAVYIMPCVSLIEWRKNIELKWALDLKLTMINGMFDATAEAPEPIITKKYRLQTRVSK